MDGLPHNVFNPVDAHAILIVMIFVSNMILEMSADSSVDASRTARSDISVSSESHYSIIEKEQDLIPPSERVPVDYQKNPAPVEPAQAQPQVKPAAENTPKPVELSQKAPHKESPSKEQPNKENAESEKKQPTPAPAAETKPLPEKKEVPAETSQKHGAKEEEKPKQAAAEKPALPQVTCAKQCTDQCLAKYQTTVQALIICLKACKCEQPATEQLLQSMSHCNYII